MNGILLLGTDEVIESRARRYKVSLRCGEVVELPFEKTLITTPGTRIPWDLLLAAWRLLENWDAAVPLWRYDVTAASVGTAEEQAATRVVIRDLRVLLHAYELLFVRRNEAGEALVAAWVEECAAPPAPQRGEQRLAFLRALYRVKPRLCVLPTSWLAAIEAQQVIRAKSPNAGRPLVMIELEPGRLVKCHAGDEEKVREHYRRQKVARR
jgi:hypothetical protein